MNRLTGPCVDIHTHILPGVDDGPATMAESLQMAEAFIREGVTKIIATPHYITGTAWSIKPEKVLEKVDEFKTTLAEHGMDLEVQPGMEIGFHRKMEENILERNLLPLGDSELYLIEAAFEGGQDDLIPAIRTLLGNGVGLILAHPERVRYFQKDYRTLTRLVDEGLRLQVNAGSFLGRFGNRSRATAEALAKHDIIHFIASDAHDTSGRPPVTIGDWATLLEPGFAYHGVVSRSFLNLRDVFCQQMRGSIVGND